MKKQATKIIWPAILNSTIFRLEVSGIYLCLFSSMYVYVCKIKRKCVKKRCVQKKYGWCIKLEGL